MPNLIREATRKARKAYRCAICTGPINPGDTCRVSTYVYDGSLYDFRCCQPCDADNITAIVWHWCGRPDEGVTEEDAIEWARETGTSASERFLARAGIDGVSA